MTSKCFASVVEGAAILLLAMAHMGAQDNGAAIRGRIIAADSGRPLRRAQITAAPDSGSDTRTASTTADGRYEIKNLSDGRYRISVSRSGYLPLQYGQRRPLEAPAFLTITNHAAVDRIDFALPKMGLVAGRVTDETGEPITGVLVMAMQSMYVDGQRRLVCASAFNLRTDDTGQYRLPGLAPGTYVVMATTRETWTRHTSGRDEVMGFQQTYFPGTRDVAEARRVSVGVGQRIDGLDFSMIPARTASVSGTAVDSRGRPLTGRGVGATQTIRGATGGGGNFSVGSGLVAPDGTFTIKNVPPGEYKLQARGPSSGPGGEDEAAAQTVVVNGVDVDRVALVTSRGWSITGRIRTENGTAPAISLDRARIIATVPDATNPRGGPPGGKTKINDDWTFSVSDLFGPARLSMNLPAGSAVKALLQDGRDLTDTALENKGADELTGVEIVVTNRITTVGGQLTGDSGTAVADGTVIVFGADPQKWLENSRFVRAARPDSQGVWQIQGLPPGEYFAIAIDYVQDRTWDDPQYLASLRLRAQPVTLSEGRAQSVSLKLALSK